MDTMSLHHHDNRPGGSPLVSLGQRAHANRIVPLRDGDSVGCVVDFVHHRLLFTLNDSIIKNALAINVDHDDDDDVNDIDDGSRNNATTARRRDAAVDRDSDEMSDWLALPIAGADEIASLFPCIGMHSRGSVVTARFRPPFRFDLPALLTRLRRRLIADRIARLPDPSPSLVAAVVSDRLAWAGFADVLRAASPADAPSDVIALGNDGRAVLPRLPPPTAASSERLDVRQVLRRALTGGNARAALDILTAHNAPTALRFNVGCVAIAQMAQANASATVVTNFAQQFVVPLRDCEPLGTPEHRRRHLLLRSAVGLLAFPSGGSRERTVADLFASMPIQSLAASANSALLDTPSPPPVAAASNGGGGGAGGGENGSHEELSRAHDDVLSMRAINMAQSLLARRTDVGATFAVPATAASTAAIPAPVHVPPPPPANGASMSAMEVLVRHRAALLALLAASGSAEAALLLSGDVLSSP
jgi:hypothetical protein